MCTSSIKSAVPSNTFSISEEERIWLREFFHDLLFEDPGAYVLYGSKPMSWSCIQKALTDEEKIQMEMWYSSLINEEKAKYRVRKRDRYDFHANFQKWQKIKDRFPIKQYLFGIFPPRFGPDGPESLLFINVEMTLKTLLKYYEDFRRVLGFDFDPIQAVFDIENKESKFWNGVMQNDALIGILLGFGRDNAWFFEWQMQHEKEHNKIGSFVKSLPLISSEDEKNEIFCPNSQHFMLPIFNIYGLHSNTKLIEQYKKEREWIKSLYRGRDQVDVTLEWLVR